MFGYDAEDIVGRNIRILLNDPLRGSDGARMPRHPGAGFSGTDLLRDIEGRRKDGSDFPIEVAISEVSYDHARLFVWFVRDLSAQRKAEAELEKSAHGADGRHRRHGRRARA